MTKTFTIKVFYKDGFAEDVLQEVEAYQIMQPTFLWVRFKEKSDPAEKKVRCHEKWLSLDNIMGITCDTTAEFRSQKEFDRHFEKEA